jgi:hypothetical protein
MVRMLVACDEAEGYGFIRGALDLARTEHSGGIAIKEQAQQHFGGIWLPTTRPVMGIQSREVKQAHAVYDEARQMLGRQTVAQAHRQIKCLLVVHGFECSTHDDQSIMTDKKHQLLSDKLLG